MASRSLRSDRLARGGQAGPGFNRRPSRIPEAAAEFVYGRNPVREALRGTRRVHTVLVAVGRAGDALEAAIADWSRVEGTGPEPTTRRVPAAELTALLGSGDHQGIAARVDPFPYVDLEQMLGTHTLLVALDGVEDPHNLGAIIRTAEGAGAGVVIPRHRAAEVTPTVVKASAGATEHASVARVRNLADSLERLKKAGFWIYGAAMEAEASYSLQDYRCPTCFVVGSEGRGLGKRVASLCDVAIRLPLIGKVESLNVSVSAGILLYEAVRQRSV